MAKPTILIATLLLMLSSGFVFASYDVADDGIKIMSDDDYKIYYDENELISGVEDETTLTSRYPHEEEVKLNSYIPSCLNG